MAEFEDWEGIAEGRPLSDDHEAAHRQLSEAEYEIDEVRKRRRPQPGQAGRTLRSAAGAVIRRAVR